MFHCLSAFTSTTSASLSGGQQPFTPVPVEPGGFRAPLASSLAPHRHAGMNGSGANRAQPYPSDRPWLSPELLSGANRPRHFDPMGPAPFGPFGGSELCGLSRLLHGSSGVYGGANLPPFPVPTSLNPSASHHLLNPLLYPHLHQAAPHLPFSAQRPFDPPYPLPRSRYLPLPAAAPGYLDRSQSDSDASHFRFPTGTPARGPPRVSATTAQTAVTSKVNLPEPKRAKVSPGATQPYYPSHFMKGTVIQLANGELKRVEDLNTEDFVRSAHLTSYLKIDSSTVVRVEERSRDFVLLSFSVGEEKVQVSVEATLEHPFFVIGQGWSSCSPERTIGVYGLSCHKLQVGDICISLTHRDVPVSKDSPVVGHTVAVADTNGTVTPVDSSIETNSHSKSPPGGDLKKKPAQPHRQMNGTAAPTVASAAAAAIPADAKISIKCRLADDGRKELSRSQPPLGEVVGLPDGHQTKRRWSLTD